MEPQEILYGYLKAAEDQMFRASECLCVWQASQKNEDLKRAMLAHENAAEAVRRYFAKKTAVKETLVAGHPNRLRLAACHRP
jgi:cystathionine beta-lyase/cystathionine gamma-synthase